MSFLSKYSNNVWSNLVFNAGDATTQFVKSLNWRYSQQTGDLKFVSQSAYKSVLVHVAKQLAMSTLTRELNDIVPKYQKYTRDKMLKEVRDTQELNNACLIKNGAESTADYGRLDCPDDNGGKYTLIAKTKYGRPVPEALILSFEGDELVTYHDTWWDEKDTESYTIKEKNTLESIWNPGNQIVHHEQNHKETEFKTKTIFHIDLAPKVTMNSSKNIVLTQVQGRDFTRKELVSGGDLTYSVSGNIVSDNEGVYPVEAVKRFVKIMQYNGLVDVNFITFGLLGVKQVIIKDFSLGDIEYKNIQPYTFSCVAVEPNDNIKLKTDTISYIDDQLSQSKWDAWYNIILENKLIEMAASSTANVATSATSSLAGAGLDALVPNI